MRILAVDDHPANLLILEEIFSPLPFEVLTAKTGEEALEVCGSVVPDLMLLDIMLPGINGYEVCRRLRSDPAFRNSKIIMVSAKAMISERLQGYEVGADDYVVKPFDEEELLAKVRVYARMRSMEEVRVLEERVLSWLHGNVNDPLRCLALPAELLRDEETMDDAQRRRLGELIVKKANGLRSFFRDVRFLAEIRAGRWQSRLEPISSAELVRDVVLAARMIAVERELRLVCSVETEGDVRVDREAMTRALRAMAEHAVRVCPSNSVLAVRAWDAPGGLGFAIGCSRETEVAAVEEAVDLDLLLDALGDDTGGVTALELALARGIVEGHGGTVRASAGPKGARSFQVMLRTAREAFVGQ